MPEMFFRVRWPDGAVQRCYSPSTVVEDHLTGGETYDLPDFVDRSRTALTIASERVRARYGFPCGNAEAQLAEIEATAAAFAGVPGATVTVESVESAGSAS